MWCRSIGLAMGRICGPAQVVELEGWAARGIRDGEDYRRAVSAAVNDVVEDLIRNSWQTPHVLKWANISGGSGLLRRYPLSGL